MPSKYKKDDKKNIIIQESFRLIQKDGIEKFSLKKLCKSLGIAQSGIFYHFKNSTYFFHKLIQMQLFEEFNYLFAQIQITKNPRRSLRRYFFYFLNYYIERPELFKLAYQNISSIKFSLEQRNELESNQFEIFDFFKDFCQEEYSSKKDFELGLVALKLQAQSLLSYYFQYSMNAESENFEKLCKLAWKNNSQNLFKPKSF